MVYLVGLVGFIGGFAIALMILKFWLKDYSRDELLNQKSLHWIYGTFSWALAFIGLFSALFVYNNL